MIRLTKATLVAVLAALAAGSAGMAGAAEMRVSLTGKSPEQIRKDIVQAASAVCWDESRSDPMRLYVYPSCVRQSTDAAVKQLGNPEVTAYNAANPVKLASR